jgi:hypothetical protein
VVAVRRPVSPRLGSCPSFYRPLGMCPCVATDRKYLYNKNQYLYINLIFVEYILNYNISHGKNTIISISQIVLSCKKMEYFSIASVQIRVHQLITQLSTQAHN